MASPLRSQRAMPPMAVQAPERTLEPEKNPPQASPLPPHVEWYNTNKELWLDVGSEQELTEATGVETEKHIVVDLYAGWCSSCKAAYPAICRVAANPEFQKNFKFVKADIQRGDVASYIRTLGVKGIPTVLVFAPGGRKLAHFGASFKKMNLVKANLTVIAANKGAEFVTDPDGYVFPKPE